MCVRICMHYSKQTYARIDVIRKECYLGFSCFLRLLRRGMLIRVTFERSLLVRRFDLQLGGDDWDL